MSFPIKLTLYSSQNFLLVSPCTQQLPSLCLAQLKDNLDKIMRAASEGLAFHCSVPSVSKYLGYKEKSGKEFLSSSSLVKWKWQVHREGISSEQTSLQCMIKLIKFLRKFGKTTYPGSFTDPFSQESQAVQEALNRLEGMLTQHSPRESEAGPVTTIEAPIPSSIIIPKKRKEKESNKEVPETSEGKISWKKRLQKAFKEPRQEVAMEEVASSRAVESSLSSVVVVEDSEAISESSLVKGSSKRIVKRTAKALEILETVILKKRLPTTRKRKLEASAADSAELVLAKKARLERCRKWLCQKEKLWKKESESFVIEEKKVKLEIEELLSFVSPLISSQPLQLLSEGGEDIEDSGEESEVDEVVEKVSPPIIPQISPKKKFLQRSEMSIFPSTSKEKSFSIKESLASESSSTETVSAEEEDFSELSKRKETQQGTSIILPFFSIQSIPSSSSQNMWELKYTAYTTKSRSLGVDRVREVGILRRSIKMSYYHLRNRMNPEKSLLKETNPVTGVRRKRLTYEKGLILILQGLGENKEYLSQYYPEELCKSHRTAFYLRKSIALAKAQLKIPFTFVSSNMLEKVKELKNKEIIDSQALGKKEEDVSSLSFCFGTFFVMNRKNKHQKDNYHIGYRCKTSIDFVSGRRHYRGALDITLKYIEIFLEKEPITLVYRTPLIGDFEILAPNEYWLKIVEGLQETLLYLQEEHSNLLVPYIKHAKKIDRQRDIEDLIKRIIKEKNLKIEILKTKATIIPKEVKKYRKEHKIFAEPSDPHVRAAILRKKTQKIMVERFEEGCVDIHTASFPLFIITQHRSRFKLKIFYTVIWSGIGRDVRYKYRSSILQSLDHIQKLTEGVKFHWQDSFVTTKNTIAISFEDVWPLILQGIEDNRCYWQEWQKTTRLPLVTQEVEDKTEEVIKLVQLKIRASGKKVPSFTPSGTLEKLFQQHQEEQAKTVQSSSQKKEERSSAVEKIRRFYSRPSQEGKTICVEIPDFRPKPIVLKTTKPAMLHLVPLLRIIYKPVGVTIPKLDIIYEYRQRNKQRGAIKDSYDVIEKNLEIIRKISHAEQTLLFWQDSLHSSTQADQLSLDKIWIKIWQGLKNQLAAMESKELLILDVTANNVTVRQLIEQSIAIVESKMTELQQNIPEFVSSNIFEELLKEVQQRFEHS